MNQEKNNITVINEEGAEVICEVLFTFDSEETNKNYIVYTDNTTDEFGSIKVYASIYDPTGTKTELTAIETDAEWELIENLLETIEKKVANDHE